MVVGMGWNELVCHVVGLDGFFEIVGTFVVKDMLLGCNSGGSWSIDNYLICSNHFS
jgi:hypothetical protein